MAKRRETPIVILPPTEAPAWDQLLEDDEPWWRAWAWVPLWGTYLLALALWMPAMRLACWAILWVAWIIGTEPTPPPAWTPWAP